MPSPIAHVAVGLAVGLIAEKLVNKRESESSLQGGSPFLALKNGYVFVAVVASMLPDLDGFVGLALSDFGRYHNNLSHSFAFGLFASLLATFVIARFVSAAKLYVFGLIFLCYSLHILMDAASVTRGVMLLWPLNENRFGLPWPLFYGVRWSEGFASWHHLISLLNELIFAAVLLGFVKRFLKKRAN